MEVIAAAPDHYQDQLPAHLSSWASCWCQFRAICGSEEHLGSKCAHFITGYVHMEMLVLCPQHTAVLVHPTGSQGHSCTCPRQGPGVGAAPTRSLILMLPWRYLQENTPLRGFIWVSVLWLDAPWRLIPHRLSRIVSKKSGSHAPSYQGPAAGDTGQSKRSHCTMRSRAVHGLLSKAMTKHEFWYHKHRIWFIISRRISPLEPRMGSTPMWLN